jgi:hypothetical protein
MTEQQDDDAKTCGICSEPFKDREVAVRAAQYQRIFAGLRADKFWAHPACVFTVAREEEAAPSKKQKSK